MKSLESIKYNNTYNYDPFFRCKTINSIELPPNHCSQEGNRVNGAFLNYAENNINVPQKILFKRPIQRLTNLSLRGSIKDEYNKIDIYIYGAYYTVLQGSIYIACISSPLYTGNSTIPDSMIPVDISKYFTLSNFINNDPNITIYNFYLFTEQTEFKKREEDSYISYYTKQWINTSGLNYYQSSKTTENKATSAHQYMQTYYNLTHFISDIQSNNIYPSSMPACIFPQDQKFYYFEGHDSPGGLYSLNQRYVRVSPMYIFKIDYNYFINSFNFETVDYSSIRTFFNQEIFQNAQVYTFLDYGDTFTERTNLLNNIQDYLVYPNEKYLYMIDSTTVTPGAADFMNKNCYSYINGNIYLENNTNYISFTQSEIDSIFNPS